MTKFRKRPAIYMVTGCLGAAVVIGTAKLFSGTFPGDMGAGIGMLATLSTGLITLSTKIIESEEKGEPHGGEQ